MPLNRALTVNLLARHSLQLAHVVVVDEQIWKISPLIGLGFLYDAPILVSLRIWL